LLEGELGHAMGRGVGKRLHEHDVAGCLRRREMLRAPRARRPFFAFRWLSLNLRVS
jgi:hypothetical protein